MNSLNLYIPNPLTCRDKSHHLNEIEAFCCLLGILLWLHGTFPPSNLHPMNQLMGDTNFSHFVNKIAPKSSNFWICVTNPLESMTKWQNIVIFLKGKSPLEKYRNSINFNTKILPLDVILKKLVDGWKWIFPQPVHLKAIWPSNRF